MDIGDFKKFSEQNFSLSSSISQISELKEAIECIEGLDSERGVKYKVMAGPILKILSVCAFPQCYLSNTESKAICDGSKLIFLTNSSASFAPCSRSIPQSSHSTDRGP